MAHMERHEAKRSDAWFLDYGLKPYASEGMFSSIDKTFSHIVKLENNESYRKGCHEINFAWGSLHY